MQIILALLAVPLTGLTLLVVLSKCLFLAETPAGWFMMASNVVYETLARILHKSRWKVDAVLTVVVTVGWGLVAGPWVAAGVGLLIALVWANALLTDIRWVRAELATQHTGYAGRGAAGVRDLSGFIPLPLPKLILQVRGPVLRRRRVLELGHWPEGREDSFELLVLNPSIVPPQLPMTLEVASSGKGVQVLGAPEGDLPAPQCGKLVRHGFRLKAAGASGGPFEVTVVLTHGTYRVRRTLRLDGIVPRGSARAVSAEIRKWKGGAGAGFAWRGDVDLFDEATFQSADAMRTTLEISNRFHLPSSVFLSARLCLDEDEHRRHSEHIGLARHPERVGDFVRFLRDECDWRAEMDFPFESDRPFAGELANHYYLHYGTHAAACEGNDWTLRARMGAGTYPWQGEDHSSFGEQRDNAVKNDQVVRDVLGVEMTSWGAPGGVRDGQTPRALEAAGVLVSSGSDASKWDKVWRMMPPHHPEGCDRMVELTTKYPGDCYDAYQVAMTKYWMTVARRTGRVYMLLNHHHLLLYRGWGCYRMTEEIFYHVLGRSQGDFYVATVGALGLYWERVLCPAHRCVKITAADGEVTVENTGDADLDRLPVEIDLPDGKRFMTLVDVPAGASRSVTI